MSRLTKQLREKMLETVLDHAFSEKQKQANVELYAAGDALYMNYHGEYLKTMQKLPASFLYRQGRMRTNIGGQRHDVFLSEQKPMSYESNNSCLVFEADNPVAIAWLKASDKVKDMADQRKAMSREVNAVLESVQTFKKLWEVWPQSKSILEKFEEKPSIAILPAVQVTRLNKVLGLPAEGDKNNEQ